MTRSVSARRLATIAAISTVALVPASASPVVAATRVEATARRGNEAAIVFEPAGTITAGSRYDVVASGFRPNTWVTIGASYDTVYWYSGVTDAAGRLRLTLDARTAGTILHQAWEQGAHRMRLKATAYIEVTGP